MPRKTIHVRPQPHTKCSGCSVRASSLFRDIPEDLLADVQRYRRTQLVVPAKSILYSENNQPEYVYTLYSGWMALSITSFSGKRQIMRFVLPGDFIGFHADARGRVTHSATAITNSVLCAFPRNYLQTVFAENPLLATRIARMQAEELQVCQQYMLTVGRKSAEEKVAFLLLELFLRVHRQSGEHVLKDQCSIHFPLTQEDIADALGLTHIHVNRVLRSFVKKDLVSCNNRVITLHNVKEIAQIGQVDIQSIPESVFIC